MRRQRIIGPSFPHLAVPVSAAGGTGGTATLTNPQANVSLTNGNLTITVISSGTATSALVTGANRVTGKYYFELHLDVAAGAANQWTWFISRVPDAYPAGYVIQKTDGTIQSPDTTTIFSIPSLNQNDTIGVALDFDNRRLWVRINGGSWNNVGSPDVGPGTPSSGIDISVAYNGVPDPFQLGVNINGNVGDQYTFNFGATAYHDLAPSGFLNW